MTGGRPSPRAREFGNLGRIGIAIALWGAFVVLLSRLLNSGSELNGAHRVCSASHGPSWWVPWVLGLLAGTGLYALITPPYTRRNLVCSVILTVTVGGGIYLFAAAVWFGQCLG